MSDFANCNTRSILAYSPANLLLATCVYYKTKHPLKHLIYLTISLLKLTTDFKPKLTRINLKQPKMMMTLIAESMKCVIFPRTLALA